MNVEGIDAIASFRFIPWGNSYFGGIDGDTQYTINGLQTWLGECGAAAPRPVSDSCWTGDVLCQDGQDQCQANMIESCAVDLIEEKQRMAGGSDSKPEFWSFIRCYANHTKSEDPVQALSNCEDHLSHDECI